MLWCIVYLFFSVKTDMEKYHPGEISLSLCHQEVRHLFNSFNISENLLWRIENPLDNLIFFTKFPLLSKYNIYTCLIRNESQELTEVSETHSDDFL